MPSPEPSVTEPKAQAYEAENADVHHAAERGQAATDR